MKDLKLLFSINKNFISDIWYILFFVFLFSLSISFFTINDSEKKKIISQMLSK